RIDFFRGRAAHAVVHRGRLINLRSRLHVHSMRAANRNVRLDYGANSWRMPSFASSTALNTSSRVRKLAPQKLIASVNTRFTSVRVSCFVFDIQPRVPSSSRFVKRKSWGADGNRMIGESSSIIEWRLGGTLAKSVTKAVGLLIAPHFCVAYVMQLS